MGNNLPFVNLGSNVTALVARDCETLREPKKKIAKGVSRRIQCHAQESKQMLRDGDPAVHVATA